MDKFKQFPGNSDNIYGYSSGSFVGMDAVFLNWKAPERFCVESVLVVFVQISSNSPKPSS